MHFDDCSSSQYQDTAWGDVTMPEVKYQALTATDAIRLLVLEPAQDESADLHGALLHATLGDCDYDLIEPYTALSYVWGQAAQTEDIHISSLAITIAATLAAALRDLRDDTRPRRIWADALCIDQSNIAERNRQVMLMGVIYGVASHTVIYLGPSTKESDLVLQSAPRSSLGIYHSLDQLGREAMVQDAKEEILTRPWFRRVWTFQELILSRDPWVQCGRRRIRWTDFCSLLLDDGIKSSLKGNEKLHMLESMNRSRHGSNAGKMLSLLQARRGLGATDARDFVFAHMGIASDREQVGNAVPVDYNSSLAKVFSRISMYIVESESVDMLLSLLDGQGGREDRRGLPSWAVDWSLPPSTYAPMYMDNLLSRGKLIMATAACMEQDNILGLLGHSVGVVKDLSTTLPLSSHLDLVGMTGYQETVSKISALYNITGGVYYTGDAFGRYARVSLRNHEQEHKELSATLFNEWALFLQALKPTAADGPGEHEAFMRYFHAWTKEQMLEPRIFVTRESSDMLRLMWEYLHPSVRKSSLDGRRLATTLEGNIGVVPAQAQQGDRVVNVMGSQVSLVLRPVYASGPDRIRLDHALGTRIRSLRVHPTVVNNNQEDFMSGVPFMTEASPVEHYTFIGTCCFDGKVPWALTQLPADECDMRIYALH